MNALEKTAFDLMLLMSLLPEKTQKEIVEEEERANRAIAEGRINKYEIQKQVDEAMKTLIQAEVRKCRPIVCYKDKMINKMLEEKK